MYKIAGYDNRNGRLAPLEVEVHGSSRAQSLVFFRGYVFMCAEVLHEMNTTEVPEPGGSFLRWKIVCDELDITLSGHELSELRKLARDKVDEKGDPKTDYRFKTYDNGQLTGDFIVTSSQGLKNFQCRGMARRAS